MSDQATQQLYIDAPREDVWAVLVDFESYPAWARELKDVTILQRDGEDRPVLVRYRAAAMGRSTTYTLCYDWSDAPNQLPWKLVTGDIMRVLDGSYVLAERGTGTDVTYTLTAELVIPLPSFVKRRAEARIIGTALRELRDHVTA